jgi:hypothetical protein
MSLLFVDGFNHYVTADLNKKWTNIGGAPTVGSTYARYGTNGVLFSSTTDCLRKAVQNEASLVIGCAFRMVAITGVSPNIICLYDGTTLQVAVRLNPDGSLTVHRGGTALTGGTSTAGLITVATWNYLEFKVTVSDSISAGSCKVRLNGVDVITVATGQDTKATSNAYATEVMFSGEGSVYSSLGAPDAWMDDIYICNQSGSTNNDFLGDCRVDTLFPSGAGNYTQFTPSTGSNYTTVDETAPNTTDYNDGASSGDRDSYVMGNLSAIASSTVYGVQVNAAILKDDAGARSAGTMVRSNSTNSDGASVALSTSQVYISQVYEQNPDGSVAWTETTVNAMEAGVKVTA